MRTPLDDQRKLEGRVCVGDGEVVVGVEVGGCDVTVTLVVVEDELVGAAVELAPGMH